MLLGQVAGCSSRALVPQGLIKLIWKENRDERGNGERETERERRRERERERERNEGKEQGTSLKKQFSQ